MSVAADLRSELRSRVPSSRSWTRHWRLSFGGASVPSSTRGCILRRVSSRFGSRATRTPLSGWTRHTIPKRAARRRAAGRSRSAVARPRRGAHEGSTLHVRQMSKRHRRAKGACQVSDEWSVVDERREAVRGDEPLLVDDYIVMTPEQTPAEEEQTRSHYPVLPAPEPDAEAIDAADAALTDPRAPDRDRRKTLTQAQDSPPLHACIGSGSGVRSRGAGG